jgi:hypothetical protein
LVPHPPLAPPHLQIPFLKKQTKKGKPSMGLWFGSLSPLLSLIHKIIKKKGGPKRENLA